MSSATPSPSSGGIPDCHSRTARGVRCIACTPKSSNWDNHMPWQLVQLRRQNGHARLQFDDGVDDKPHPSLFVEYTIAHSFIAAIARFAVELPIFHALIALGTPRRVPATAQFVACTVVSMDDALIRAARHHPRTACHLRLGGDQCSILCCSLSKPCLRAWQLTQHLIITRFGFCSRVCGNASISGGYSQLLMSTTPSFGVSITNDCGCTRHSSWRHFDIRSQPRRCRLKCMSLLHRAQLRAHRLAPTLVLLRRFGA